MPHVSDAMARSLQIGWLGTRNIATDAANFKNSFSSWDNCMAVSYCKYPVIAIIVVAGLIVLSIIICIVRCACCGLSCCCECFTCLKCCGNCCGCCDSPRERRPKYLDDPYYPPQQPQNGYRPQAPMPLMTGAIGGAGPELPKYAQFETGPTGHAVEPKKVSDDALPPMPSWESAAKKRVMTEEEPESVELGDLDPATGQNVPLMSGAQAISRTASPRSENTFPGTGPRGTGAMATGARNPADSYRRPIHSERGDYQGVGSGRAYGAQDQVMSPVGGQGYNSSPYQDSQDHDQDYFRPGVGVTPETFPRGPPQRQYTSSSGPYSPLEQQYASDPIGTGEQRPYHGSNSPPYPPETVAFPSEAYTQNQSGPHRVTSPAMTTSSSAFDFGSYGGAGNPNGPPGISPGENGNMGFGVGSGRQPSISGYSSNYAPSTAPPSYMSRSPPPQDNRGYPGYRPYQPGLQPRAPG